MFAKKFSNEKLGIEITSYIDNKQNVWFKGKDVAQILGYRDTKKAIKQHVSEENKIIQLIHPNVGGHKTPPNKMILEGNIVDLLMSLVFMSLYLVLN